MTPRERARRAFLELPDNPSENDFLEVVTAAVQAERNAGDLRREEVQAALQAALEELARVTKERDGLAAALKQTKDRCFEAICSVDDEMRRGMVFPNPLLAVSARFALASIEIADPGAILSAHDRQVAARVLREAEKLMFDEVECSKVLYMAAQYEAGEREVPGE